MVPGDEALARVRERQSLRSAIEAICLRASVGLLVTRAALTRRYPPGKSTLPPQDLPNAELPADFWGHEGRQALTANWPAGDFEWWPGKAYRWQAFGVEFAEAGIEALRMGNAPVMEYDEVVGWCRDFLADNSQERKGENPAWEAFQAFPRSRGVGRDGVFRPALQAAKAGAKRAAETD